MKWCFKNGYKNSPEIDETVEETEEFEYEVDDEELLDAVTDFIYDDYFSKTNIADNCEYVFAVKKGIKKLINDYDNLDEYVEEYDSELKDYFEAEAKEYYEQKTANWRNSKGNTRKN